LSDSRACRRTKSDRWRYTSHTTSGHRNPIANQAATNTPMWATIAHVRSSEADNDDPAFGVLIIQ
jgi:hypothetical protein